MKFNLRKPEQRDAYEFLVKLDRGQAKFVSFLIAHYFNSLGIDDVSSLTEAEAKTLLLLLANSTTNINKELYIKQLANGGLENSNKTVVRSKDDAKGSVVDLLVQKEPEEISHQNVFLEKEDLEGIGEMEEDDDEDEDLEYEINKDFFSQMHLFM